MPRIRVWRAAAALLASQLAACATAEVAQPGDASLDCEQIRQEIAAQDAAAAKADRRAAELRPQYYAVSAVGLIPFVGDGVGIADQVSDMSGSRKLDHLSEDAHDARRRSAYLGKMASGRCAATAEAAASPAPE